MADNRIRWNMDPLQVDIGDWVTELFDKFTPNDQDDMSRAKRCIRKLKTEVKELEDKPWDQHEYADCFIALMAGAYFQNFNLLTAVQEKMEINHRREWKLNKNGTISHVKKPKKEAVA